MKHSLPLLVLAMFLVVGSHVPTLAQTPPATEAATQTASAGDPILVGAGDIASCSQPGDSETAKLIEAMLPDPNLRVFTAGDNAYELGSPLDFLRCYEPTWGQFKDITYPTPGNRDYVLPGAIAYFAYFGSNAGPRGLGYYSFDLGQWHIVSADSIIETTADSPQGKWFKADLEAHSDMCTIAIWHYPLFASGGDTKGVSMRPFWQIAYDHHVDLIIDGDVHAYERFAPQTPQGKADPKAGIREFVVGTGGGILNPPTGRVVRNSEAHNFGTWGVLKLTLHPDSYDWEFIPVPGKTFHDSGSAPCGAARSAS